MNGNRHLVGELDYLAHRHNQLAAIERDQRGPPPTRGELTAIQAEYDATYRSLGAAAPAAEPGEGSRTYRAKLIGALLPYTSTLKTANAYAAIGTPIEQMVRDEVASNLADRHRGDPEYPHRMRKVEVVDEATGARRTEWRGDDARGWMNRFMSPFQVATEIKTFDRAGNPAPPVTRWGHPPRR
jgi:hypothetical protein